MDRKTWVTHAERQLGGPLHALDYAPLPDVRVPVLPVATSSSRGHSAEAGWQIAVVCGGVPEEAAQEVRQAVEGGADCIRLSLSLFRGATDVSHALRAFDPTQHALELVEAQIGDAASVVALMQARRQPLDQVRIDFALDPIGLVNRTFVTPGDLAVHIDTAAEAARWVHEHMPASRALVADDTVWHDAGADEAWSMALMFATVVHYLRALERHGLQGEHAFHQIMLRQAMPGAFLLGVAKLRATRRIGARIADLCNARTQFVQSTTSAWREHTELDASVNILRNTASTFAGIVGGSQRIETRPHDDTPEARRLARNLQLILRDEAALGRVEDPAGGAHAIEALTDSLAQAAWRHFQHIESLGGIITALDSGHIGQVIQSSWDRTELQVRMRKIPILGVTRFPNVNEPSHNGWLADEQPTMVPDGLPPAATFAELLAHGLDAPASQLTSARVGHGLSKGRIPRATRRSETFEMLRSRHERRPPKVFLGTVGPLAEHNARTAFGRELLQTGGFEVVESGQPADLDALVQAYLDAPTRSALLSMIDRRFATDAVQALERLTLAGARVFVLGEPGDLRPALEKAGARGFLKQGIDIHAALVAL